MIGVNIGMFFLLYRRQLHGRFDLKRLPSPEESVKHPAYFRYTCAVLLLVAPAYIVASTARLSLSLVALGGALLLAAGTFAWKRAFFRDLRKHISWSIFGFIAGMFLVVRAVETTGLMAQFGQLLLHLAGNSEIGAVMVGTTGSSLGTNLMNNISMAVVLASALHSVQHAPPSIQQGFLAASMFGCDLGPNLTTVGSLATVLWLLILRRRNIDVSGLDYFKVGIVVTPLMLLIGALTIWLMLRI